MEVSEAICVLLSNENARTEFLADRAAWLHTNGVDDAHQTLAKIDADELATQAQVLVDKRFGEASEFIPRTLTTLGKGARQTFATYLAQSPWPTGNHLRHINDVIAFLEWLRREQPQAVCGVEWVDCLGALHFRRDGSRVLARISGQRDVGFLATYVVMVTFWRQRWTLLFPLPFPSFLWRWKEKRTLPPAEVNLLRA